MKKIIERIPARTKKFLVKLECGHKRYTDSKTVKSMKCECEKTS